MLRFEPGSGIEVTNDVVPDAVQKGIKILNGANYFLG